MNRILSYPGIDKNSLAQKKINWFASIAVTLMIFCVTMTYHLVFPQLRILIYYGLILTAIYLQGIIFPIFFHYSGVWRAFIDQSLVVILTFFCILLLGGISWSGGLIFVGLAQVFFSLNFREKRATLLIFILYTITIITAGLLNPFLTVPPEMTPSVNISLFVVNLLWISGFAFVFILSFISQNIKLEHMETERIKELDDAKTRLYTNIAHEFRTPLTIITGMTDLMRNDPGNWLNQGTDKIDRNAGILLTLVNQMLDLSKLESGAMSVRLIRSDINPYMRSVIEMFRSVAASLKITLNYLPSKKDLVIDYDPDKLMQIISNLLSNALKFTPSGGVIEVKTALTDNGFFEIRVSDNGTGIPESHLPFIFDRFYRVEINDERVSTGTGLGLALTKELVKLLDGTIAVESLFGEGTEFTVTLPVTESAGLQEGPGLHEIKRKIAGYIVHPVRREQRSQPARHDHHEKPMLLIVEDNDDVIMYLLTFLGKDYDVIVAVNGEEGMTKALEQVPDIILSDIMMPVMDGLEMLERIKNDLRTSHIPIVLLTAKADIASRLKGLDRGADAYIAKPFGREELQVQLKALIAQRKRLQERYAVIGQLVLTKEKDFQFEDSFMHKVRDIMIANMSDESFDIQRLCSGMAMSRTQVYRKFRSLTDKTITEYLRSLRLHTAKELLIISNITVAAAAYKTGFKNVSHFSRAFTQEFGINPSSVIRLPLTGHYGMLSKMIGTQRKTDTAHFL